MKILSISANNSYIKVCNHTGSALRGKAQTLNIENILKRLGFSNTNAKYVSEEIYTSYARPERGYHGLKHIKNMLESFDKFILESNQAFMVKNTDELRFAILMHDYINGEADDVKKSAYMANEFLHRISPNYDSSYVENLILATDYSQKQNLNFEQQLMQDIDTEILGKSPAEYKQYSGAIRQQYANYPDKIYNPARIKVLEAFINKDKIYNTPYYREKYEQQARENIKYEINTLL